MAATPVVAAATPVVAAATPVVAAATPVVAAATSTPVAAAVLAVISKAEDFLDPHLFSLLLSWNSHPERSHCY
jgi:hypothetical protein